MTDMHTDTYIAGNAPEATPTFGNLTSHLYPNKSTNDLLLVENTVDGNSLTYERNNFGHARLSQVETAGGDWSLFYAGDSVTNQDQWGFGLINNSAHRDSSVLNTASRDGMGWNTLYALNDFNNIQTPPGVWTDAQGEVINMLKNIKKSACHLPMPPHHAMQSKFISCFQACQIVLSVVEENSSLTNAVDFNIISHHVCIEDYHRAFA